MSKLAAKLVDSSPTPIPSRPGPANKCFPLYGEGDLDAWELVTLRLNDHTWREVQAWVDEKAGVDNPIHLEKFRYHWRRRCYCWPEELRLS